MMKLLGFITAKMFFGIRLIGLFDFGFELEYEIRLQRCEE